MENSSSLLCFHFLIFWLLRLGNGVPINLVFLFDPGNEAFKEATMKGVTKVLGAEITVNAIEVKSTWDEKKVCDAVFDKSKNPTLMIDATRMGQTSILAMAKRMGIPTVSTQPMITELWENRTNYEKDYLIHIQPPDLVIADLVSALHGYDAFKSLEVIYDNNFNIADLVKKRVAAMNNNNTAVEELKDTSSIASILEKLKKEHLGNLVAFASVKNLNNLLSEGNKKNCFKRQFSWVVASKDDENVQCPACINATFYYFKPTVQNKEEETAYNTNAYTSENKVDKAFYYDLARILGNLLNTQVGKNDESWPSKLTYGKCGENLTTEQIAERSNVKLGTFLGDDSINKKGVFGDFVLKPSNERFQSIRMDVIEMIYTNGTLASKALGIQYMKKSPDNPSSFLSGKDLTGFKDKRAAVMLRITTLEEPPFIYKIRDEKGNPVLDSEKNEMFEGYCIDLIDAIKMQANLNFEYTIFETREKVFGEMHPQGPGKTISWSGMIGDLVNNSADIALGPLAVMAERETVVDFTVPYYDLVGISILMKKPEVKSSLFKFLTVLETNVWMCILGAYFFTSFLMYLFDRLSPYSVYNNKELYKDDEENRDFNIKECLWFCMTSLTPQGGGEAPRNVSGRLVAATWWLFGFIIIASYTANLAAFLTVSRLDSSIESLDDLSKQYKIKYAPVEGSTSQTYFRRMAHIEERFYEIWKNMSLDDKLNETERAKLAVWDYPVSDKYTKIWLNMQDTEFPPNLEIGINQTLASAGPSEGFALIADSTQVKYATMIYCELTQVGSEFSRKPLALAVQQGSDLKDKLSSAILKLLNERKLESLKEEWWTKNKFKSKCEDKDKQSDGISIANIGGVFIVIFIGVVLACITLAVEYFYYKGKRTDADGKVVAVKDYGSKDPMKR